MLKISLSSFILIVGCANLISSQQVRPLPRPIISIRCGQLSVIRNTGLLPPRDNQAMPTTCTYRINAINFQICQMRLDFHTFSIGQPSIDKADPSAPYQKCNGNRLTVGNFTLCGENSGQHVYIPISPRQGERQLTVSIVSNGFGNGNGRPNWNIAVHQFECPLGQSRSLNVLPATDKQEIMRTPRALISDWLAPAGCLQYHALPTGQIESFNFNNGAGPYIGDMNYAICFRRPRGTIALKLITTTFRLNNGVPTNDGFDDDCLDQFGTKNRSEDYLFIPSAEMNAEPSRARLFCGQSLTSRIITSTPPGPLNLVFNSDREYAEAEEIGFRMQYEIV